LLVSSDGRWSSGAVWLPCRGAQIAELRRQLDAQREHVAALESMASALADVKARFTAFSRSAPAPVPLQVTATNGCRHRRRARRVVGRFH